MKARKFAICLLAGLFFMLLAASANPPSSAAAREASIIFEVG
jgi:hypothetical protein